jgi:hypothetical protein
VFFNSNTKVLIFAIHPHKVSFFFFSIQPILSKKFHITPIFIFYKKKGANLGCKKWLDGQRGGYSYLDFFRGNMESFGCNWSNCKNLKLWGVNCKN